MKNTIKFIEVTFWLPFASIGFMAHLIWLGILGGWHFVEELHEFIDKE